MVINDETVNRMIDYLKERGQCSSSIRSHQDCYDDFQKFLGTDRHEWDESDARQWLDNLRERRGRNLSRVWSQYLSQLHEVSETGEVADRHFFLVVPAYKKMEGSFKVDLDEYLESCKTKYTERSLQLARNYLSAVLLFFTDLGKTSVKELSYQDLEIFLRHDFNCSSKNRAMIIGHARRLFEFLFKQGKCPEGFHLYLNDNHAAYVRQLDQFSTKNQGIILSAAKESMEFPVDEYRTAVEDFISQLEGKKYASTSKKVAREVLLLLYLFLDINGLGYHPAITEAWFDELKPVLPRCWSSWRRALSLFDEYTRNGGFYTERFIFSSSTFDSLPEWMKIQIRAFQDEKRKEFRSPGTVRKVMYPCVKFCSFLLERGCQSFDELNSDLLKEFCFNDKHHTVKGRSSCLGDIRQFIIFLEEQGTVSSPNLHVCISAGAASGEKIVDVLTDDQIEAIDQYRKNSHTPMELRTTAIVLLGLKMGLRASDVVNLKFDDINWKESSLSIIQKKTLVYITLPMPVEVGNAIYLYIRDGRPECDNDFIFVRHKAPYGKLSEKICADSLIHILPERTEVKGGFHVTRRTFATMILRNGSGAQTVMDALGHTDPTSVMKYLAMDESHMRLCPLSLRELGLDRKEA